MNLHSHLHVPDHMGVVASATAEEVAAICAPTCGVTLSALESLGSRVSYPQHSNWDTYWRRRVIILRIGIFLIFFSYAFSYFVWFGHCFHIYPSTDGQSFQKKTWFSSMFLQRRSRKLVDNGESWDINLTQRLQPTRIEETSFMNRFTQQQKHHPIQSLNFLDLFPPI